MVYPCLTAKMGTGGNNVPMIYELGRKYTVKECLALMGFPKKYKIKANNQQSYKQVGNERLCKPYRKNIKKYYRGFKTIVYFPLLLPDPVEI